MALTSLQQLAEDNIVFTATAIETVSGGQFVVAKANNDVVNANGFASSLGDDEILVGRMDAATDDEAVVGIALDTVVSGAVVSVATRGIYIVGTQAAISAGFSVSPSNVADAFCNAVITTADTEEEFKVGRALTSSSASGAFIVMSLNV